jgi:hypothetical protein
MGSLLVKLVELGLQSIPKVLELLAGEQGALGSDE